MSYKKKTGVHSSKPEEFACMAAASKSDPPQDCDFPFCGCSRNASEAVATLLECGWVNQEEATQLRREIASLKATNSRLRAAMKGIDMALRIPAAEYVPAIGDVFRIIDSAKERGEKE